MSRTKCAVVPGGSSVRSGVYLAARRDLHAAHVRQCPAAYVDEGTMIDSHALVGSCAQIGKRRAPEARAAAGGWSAGTGETLRR